MSVEPTDNPSLTAAPLNLADELSEPMVSPDEPVTSGAAVGAVALSATPVPSKGFFSRPILYEEPLKWFLLLSCLDIFFTWIVLHMGGSEVNWLANYILTHGDLYGLVAFKFTMVVIIILLCDFVGRRNDIRGRFIAKAAVIITSFPVILASMQLLIFVYA